MSKLTNLLIPLIMISTGVISCTSQSLVRKSDVHQQALLQHEWKDATNQTGYTGISTKNKTPTINTKSKYAVNKAIGKENDANGVISWIRKVINRIRKSKPVIFDYANTVENDPTYEEFTTVNLIEKTETLTETEEESGERYIYNLSAGQQDKKDLSQVGLTHLNPGIAYAERDVYKEEGRLKRSQLEYEKALESEPEHPIARSSLSEIYYSLGTSYLENKKYDNAVDAFDKVLELNPGFPQIKEVLEKAHYNLGVNYVKNKELDNAIMEFNKAIGINPNYAKLDKNIFSTISKGKKIIFGKPTHHGRNHSSKNIRNSSTTNDVGKEGSHKEEKESKPLHKQIPHEIGVSEEIILAEKGNAKESEYDQNQVENQLSLLFSQEDNKSKFVQSNKALFETGQLKKADDSGHENVQLKIEISNEGQGKKQIQEKIAHIKTVDTEGTDDNILASTYIVPGEIKSTSGHRVFSYYITRNYNSSIGFKDAIKKYENATRKNHYDNTAFRSLAHAYYSKAMHLDYAIARREEDPPGSNQNYLVQRYYLNDDVGDEVVSRVSSTEQTKILEEYNMTFHNKLGNVYHKREMFSEAIKEYKNALKIDPNSSKTLYSLAFSFSKKGSYPGIALRSKSNSKRTLSGF